MARRVLVTNKNGSTNTIVANEEFISFLESNGATVSDIDPENPEPTISEPTELEKLRADIDYLAAMGGVTL